MTAVEVFAIVASGLILALVTTLRGGDDQDRKSEWADYATGGIVLFLTWFAAVGLSLLI